MFNKYKEKRIKVGDTVLIKLNKNSQLLSVNNRDYLEFNSSNNNNQFTIENVKDSNGNDMKLGEFIKYGYTFNLKSNKAGTKNIGVYKNEKTYSSKKRRNAPAQIIDLKHFDMLVVSEYNTENYFNYRYPDERVTNISFHTEDNINDDNVSVEHPLKIKLAFNYKTGFLDYCKSGFNKDKAAIKDNGEKMILHIV